MIPKEKKGKKTKQLSEDALQIAEKRREAKGRREKKRYTHLNADVKVTQLCLTFATPWTIQSM